MNREPCVDGINRGDRFVGVADGAASSRLGRVHPKALFYDPVYASIAFAG
jgi:hypothetical protein